MSNKSPDHDTHSSQPLDPIPSDERIPSESTELWEFSAPKAIILPSAQVPAEPPKPAQAPPKPSQSDATEK